jgi:hypothetical protein
LRDSIEWTAPVREGDVTVGYVGSNHPEAVWHELGTKHIPPRPFLSTAAMAKEREIHDMAGRLVFGAIVHGGPNYRKFMEAVHALRHMAYQAKEFFEEMVDEDRKRAIAIMWKPTVKELETIGRTFRFEHAQWVAAKIESMPRWRAWLGNGGNAAARAHPTTET